MATVPLAPVSHSTPVPRSTSVPVYSGSHTRARRAPEPAPRVIRRRPSPTQGRSLEILGHAIEYLVDCELRNRRHQGYSPDVSAAVDLLSRLSREVFAECREIVPLRSRVWRRITRVFGRHVPASA